MRFRVIKVCYFSIIFLIILRLGYWQIIRADDLSALGEGQRISSTAVLAPRGSILFSDLAGLATTQPAYLVYAQPKLIPDKKFTSRVLSDIFWSVDPRNTPDLDDQSKKNLKDNLLADIEGKLNSNLFWISLGRVVNLDTKQEIDKLHLDGIGFDQDYLRFYPEGSSSAHLLGFVGSDVYGAQTGYFGLEGYYNGELKGRNGTLVEEKDAQGLPILIGKFLSREPQSGKTLVLNVNQSIQHIVEKKLAEGMTQFGARGASAIVMDPKTGGILAMASYPSYDPNQPELYPKDNFKNSAIADAYEPGSTFKVLVMAAAINEGKVTPDTICDSCSGPTPIDGFDIRTWDNKYFPNSTMTDVIIHSDNTGMVFVSKKLGVDTLYSYLNKFGIGDLTGIDLQDEASPDLRPSKNWRDIDLATASFGQGISVTALQLVRAVDAIANGGRLMEPHVVSQIKDVSQSLTVAPRVVSQPISQETSKKITEMMIEAVDKGEAQFYKKFEGVGGFKIAGKTGTAQIPIAGHYDSNKTIASFVGFAPADDPKFVMLIKYDQPSASIYGAETAAPTFFQIAKELFNYFGIAPTEH